MPTVNLSKAGSELGSLVRQALAGEEVVIAVEGRPVARLVPVNDGAPAPKRQFGLLRGRVRMGDDFNDPLPEEMMRAFRGEES